MDPVLPEPFAVAVDFDVSRIAWSPDGRKLAVAGHGPSGAIAALVDAGSRSLDWRVELTPSGTVQSLAFAPDGAAFAVGAFGIGGGVAKLLDPGGATLWERSGGVMHDIVFSPDGLLLALAEDHLRVVDVATGAERFSPSVGDALPNTPAFTADSGSIAVASNRQCRLCDTATGEERWTADIGTLPTSTAFAAGETRLVVARYREGVDVLASDTGAPLSSSQLAGAVPATSFYVDNTYHISPDGSWLVRVARGTQERSAVGIWATSDGSARFATRPLAPAPPPPQHPAGANVDLINWIARSQQWVRFSPDGRLVVIACGETAPGFMVLDAVTGAKLAEDLSEPTVAVAFDRDGHSLAIAGERSVNIFAEDRIKLRSQLNGAIKVLAISTDGPARVAAGTDREASVFDVGSETRVLLRQYAIAVLTALTLSADGKTLAAADASGGVDLYAVDQATRTWHAGAPGSPVVGLQFLPGANSDLVTATLNPTPTLRRLSRATGAQIWACPHPRNITMIAVDPTGAWIATGCADGRTRVIEAATGNVEPITIERNGATIAVRFTTFASLLSADANGVVLADVPSGGHIAEIAQPDLISAADINRNGSLIATVADNQLLLWGLLPAGGRNDQETLDVLASRPFDAALTHVLFSPSTQHLCVATDDSTVLILDLPKLTTRATHHHLQRVSAIAYSNDATLLVTACADGRLTAFDEAS